MARKPKSSPKRKFVSQRTRKLHRLSLFALLFGIIGAGFLLYSTHAAVSFVPYPPHRAECVENTPKKTIVRPNESFTVRVRMRNTGSSVWSPSYGFYLSEYSSGATSGNLIWNASGGTFKGSYGNGAVPTFNLTVRAPSTPGSYPMSWGMHVVFQGYVRNPCSAKTIRVMNPPVVTLLTNNQNRDITVTKGSSLTMKWTATNDTKRCIGSGAWSGDQTPAPGGTSNQSSDTSSTGTKTYTLTCYNALLIGSSATRRVTVVNPPASGGGGSSGGGSSSGGSSGPASSPAPASPASDDSGPDKTAPSSPTDFSAEIVDDATVALSWSPATDNIGVKGYELDRSKGKEKWEPLGGGVLQDLLYSDTSIQFETTYNYRVRAIDEAGNASKYATVSATTNPFNANVKPDEPSTLTSENGVVTVVIPSGAVTSPALCVLRVDDENIAPEVKGYKTFSGPLELLCKEADGNVLSSFEQPVQVNVQLDDKQKNDFTSVAYYVHNDGWQQVSTDDPLNLSGFELQENTTFAVLSAGQSSPLWQKLLLGLLIGLVTIGGGLFLVLLFLRLKQRRDYQKKYQDYHRKERGF